MRTTSRMVVVASLILALAGCGSKPSPSSQADVPFTSGPNTDPNPNPTKAGYELDPAKHVIPTGPVSGAVGGAAVNPTAVVEGDFLKFQVLKPGTEEPEREIAIRLR